MLLQFVVFAFTLWFGAYLLAHDARKPTLFWTGSGLIAFAAALALDALFERRPGDLPLLAGARWLVVLVPAVCWLATLLAVSRSSDARPPRSLIALILTATLFFGLGFGLLLLPLKLFPDTWMISAIGGDMALLGYAVIRMDAFDEGQAFARAALRSLIGAAAIALLVGGQLALIGRVGNLPEDAILLLTFSLSATFILLFAFAGGLSTVLDRLAFARQPDVQQERADLRAAEQSVALRAATALSDLSDADFARLTRRALSAYGDVKRLSGSPLIDLPVIAERLKARGAADNTLERAAELKALLGESIERLKPREGMPFNASDAWRYYNALFFVYVVGLRPYSLRADHDGLDEPSQAALAWFRAQVPERTLHNWQNAAAQLVADDLREQPTATEAAGRNNRQLEKTGSRWQLNG